MDLVTSYYRALFFSKQYKGRKEVLCAQKKENLQESLSERLLLQLSLQLEFHLHADESNSQYNRPFPSSYQPPFQSEAKCKDCYENQFSFILKLELITMTKISHLDSL